jgi:hypothetical protein
MKNAGFSFSFKASQLKGAYLPHLISFPLFNCFIASSFRTLAKESNEMICVFNTHTFPPMDLKLSDRPTRTQSNILNCVTSAGPRFTSTLILNDASKPEVPKNVSQNRS